MKLFKNIDEKFAQIGFLKVCENEFGAKYERLSKRGYIQRVDLVRKQSGLHLIQSYEAGVNSDGFNNCVGLTMYEARLCLIKMRRMGWRVTKC